MTYLEETIVRLVIESEPKGMSVDEITEAITRLARTDAKLKQEWDAENLKTLKLEEAKQKRKFKKDMK
jgi:hypothetical protein